MEEDDRPLVRLFSYGTLQWPQVQIATFGRLVEGRPDALTGFRLSACAISDPKVVETSGAAIHTIARPSGDPSDRIEGVVFAITAAELQAADLYEVDAVRAEVTLASGAKAFVYIGRNAGSGSDPVNQSVR
ncbi:gamma-glutamylcyclotransferase family protein [Sphingomonas sp.]|uniref:gamma-glutamylcyclotransferase family protein n=1 Tax=Sphingomonas sp. TaxID=28214 RepID=UPI002FCB48BA